MKTKLSALILFAIIASTCYSQSKPIDFDYGRIENSKYLNSYFDFEITIPANWIIQNKEQMEKMAKAGMDMVVGDDANLKAAVKVSEINTANLLVVNQYERGSAVDYNPGLVIVAENIKEYPGIKTGSDYLFQVRKLLNQSQVKYDYIDTETSRESISGIDFYKMNAGIEYMGIGIKQIYYSTVLKGFSLNVIISFINDEQKAGLITAIDSIKFNE
ncbi:MAG: hypothetical protein Q7U54_10670 [Bacteroidales bacterium]|nr:hypothetical protein [Bacteroidales bacterium]